MNILHIYKDYAPVVGGIENHIRALAERCAALGHDVTVLVTSLDRRTRIEERNGVQVVKAGRWVNISSAPISPAMFRWARRLGREAGVVHLHFPYPIGELAHLFSGSPAKTVISYHSDIIRQKNLLRVYRPLMWQVLKRADRILPTNPRYIESSPVLSRLRDKCTVVPLGIDIDRFAAADPARVDALRHQLTNQQTGALLLTVGRLRYYKGLDTLIQALPDLPFVRCIVVGSGPMEAEWRALAKSLSVANQITFVGDVPDSDLPAYYHAADLYVLPANSRAEAFGVALVEAMAAGLPCITTEVGTGSSWVVQHGVTGLIVPPRDPPALAQAIRALVDDHVLRREIGQAAAGRARAEFGEALMIDRVLDVYASLLPGTPPGEPA